MRDTNESENVVECNYLKIAKLLRSKAWQLARTVHFRKVRRRRFFSSKARGERAKRERVWGKEGARRRGGGGGGGGG